MRSRYLLLLLALTVRAEGDTSEVRFVSGENRVQLIELYTSEGCSSCPPADRWLSGLRRDERLFEDFVPVAFHVDYWDYIGWKDRFASAEYSARQRRYARELGDRAVYTPGMFLNGDEWTGWRTRAPKIPDGEVTGELAVDVRGPTVSLHFAPVNDDIEAQYAYVALLGMNRQTEVRAGENRGRTLRHDFVVLELVKARLRSREETQP